MRTVLFFILYIVSFATSHSQIIPFKNYTVHDGLPSNYISDIVQDHKGYMWFASDFGLSKFDGYNFKTYTIEDGLSDSYSTCLTVDEDGNVWVGTEIGGVCKLNDFGVSIYDQSNGLFEGAVDKIFTDNNNRVWACGRQEGVSVIDKDSLCTFTSENSELSSEVYSYFVDSKGWVWLGTYNGAYYFDTALHKFHNTEMDDVIWDIIEDKKGDIWFASETNGVYRWNGETLSNYSTENGLTTNTTLALYANDSAQVFVGTYLGGINIIKADGSVSYELVEQTKEYWLWDLFEDSNGRIWGRTQESGVLLIQNNEIRNFSKENKLVSQFPLDVFEDCFKNIWIITKDGISVYGKVIFENYTDGFVADDAHILSIYIDSNTSIYTGSYHGLTIFKKNQDINTFSYKDGLPNDATIQKVFEDKRNRIWLGSNGVSQLDNNKFFHFPITKMEDGFATSDIVELNDNLFCASEQGLLIFNTNTKDYKIISEKDGLISNDVYTLSIDKQNRIWCGTSDGLSVYDGEEFYNYTVEDGLPNNFCNDIAFDANGNAWLATDFGVSLIKLNDDFTISTKNFSVEDGLSSNTTLSLAVDKYNNVWLGNNKGVDHIDQKSYSIKNYSKNEGFLPIENNLGAITTDIEGNIWFGTINGIVKYSSKNDKTNQQAPYVYINAINLYNDTSSIQGFYTHIDSSNQLPENLQLHHSKKNVFFEYTGLHYTIVNKNTYQYRLLGYEDNWSASTTDVQSIPYQKLPHGKYTFQVKAANCDGVWTEVPAEFSFEILPPFWKTWWFRIIELLAGILIFMLVTNLRERKLRRDKKVLKQKVKERTIAIEKQKDHIEIQRDEITKQKKEITDSIHYAKHIQSAVLPKDETIAPLLKDYFILYKPRDIVSGDFYWINGNKNKVIVLAADCTGHGVPGAFMSMLGVSILNEIAANPENHQAGKILDLLREHIIATLSHTAKNEEARDGMDLALCIIDFKENKLQFAGAYNPLLLIRNNELIVHKADKMPVGSHSGEISSFTTQEIAIQKDDCLYMFSDGYADQFGGPKGKKFMSGKFKKLLLEIHNQAMPNQKAMLDETIENWMANHEQIDDILVMGIRIK